MTTNVRKLAFDLAFPWLVPLQLLAALTLDYGYLHKPDLSVAFITGIMLSLQATAAYNRVALWRILPVSRREIGQARWWQMIGLPGVGIIAAMATAFLLHVVLSAVGWNHVPLRADVIAIVCDLLLPFFYPVFLTVFSLAIAVVRITRSPLAYTAAILVWAPWLLLIPHAVPFLPSQTRILALGLAGLIIAAILSITALRWPLPITQPLQLDIGGRDRPARTQHPAGQGGWIALCAMAAMRPAIVVSLTLVAYLGAILAFRLDRILFMQLEYFVVVMVLMQLTAFNANALRVLRALPASALALTAYLFLLPLALVTASVFFFSLVLEPWLMDDIPLLDIVALSATLCVSALVLPAALSMRQTAMSLTIWLSMIPVGLLRLSWAHIPPPWHDERILEGVALLTVCGGFFWMRAQISRGSKVYRLQPFAPARWRGNS